MIISVFPDSSALARAVYQPAHAVLYIEFRDGSGYRFHGVPLAVFSSLLGAISKGAFFNSHIRTAFPSTRLPVSISI